MKLKISYTIKSMKAVRLPTVILSYFASTEPYQTMTAFNPLKRMDAKNGKKEPQNAARMPSLYVISLV